MNALTDHKWNEEEIERLRTLYNEGVSASQIAKILGGGLTRSAVLGKIHRTRMTRDGFIAKARPQKSGEKGKRVYKYRFLNKRTPPSIPQPLVLAPTGPVVKLLDLEPDMCRWPVGDPHEAGFGFCGGRAQVQSYCAYHAQTAFVPLSALRRRSA